MRAKITTTGYDGTVATFEGEFAGWGDQIAFERRFEINAAVLSRLGESFNEDGSLRSDADPSAIRSEWLAYLAWRLMMRGPASGVDFEAWIENLAELDILQLAVEDDAVPTTAIATPLPSN